MAANKAEQLDQLIQQHNNILLVAGLERRFDTLTSCVALAHVLFQLEKNATVYYARPLPEQLDFLELANHVSAHLHRENDCAIVVDTEKTPVAGIRYKKDKRHLKIILRGNNSTPVPRENIHIEGGGTSWDAIITVGVDTLDDLKRELASASLDISSIPVFAIHTENKTPYAEEGFALIDTEASSCAEVITRFCKEFYEEALTQEATTTLLAGLMSATQNFQNARIQPQTLFAAAYLIGRGAEQKRIVQHLYKTKSLEFIKLWGCVMTKLLWEDEKKIGWSTVTQEDLASSGADLAHVAPLLTELRNTIAGASLFILGVERGTRNYTALIHSPNDTVLELFAKRLNSPIKNQTILVPLKGYHSLGQETELFVRAVKEIL